MVRTNSTQAKEQLDGELLRMVRWLEKQPYNRRGADKTDVVLNLWGLVQSFQAARPAARGEDAALD